MALPASARVFSFQKEHVAAYVRGSIGTNVMHQDAFASASGNQTTFGDDESIFIFTGELGAQFSFGPVGFRLGFETIRPKEVEIAGKNSSGQELFTLNSEVFAYGPTAAFEYNYRALSSIRFFVFLGVTYAMIDMDNRYQMTAQGTSTYPSITNFTEKGEGTAFAINGGFGLETAFVDNVTFALDIGYRHMPVSKLKHRHPNTTFAQGAVNKGDEVKNADGTARAFDMSGFAISAAFRFYISFL